MPHPKRTPLECIATALTEWQAKQQGRADGSFSALRILDEVRDPILNSDQVYIPFASKGMFEKNCGSEGPLAADGRRRQGEVVE